MSSHTVSIIGGLQHILKSSSRSPPTLFFTMTALDSSMLYIPFTFQKELVNLSKNNEDFWLALYWIYIMQFLSVLSYKYRSCQLITESCWNCWLWIYLYSPIVLLVLLNIFWNSVNIWLYIRFFNWPFYIYFLNVLLCDWQYSFSDFHFA